MNAFFFVENIKCSGCAKKIVDTLSDIVDNVHVDVDSGKVSFKYDAYKEVEEVIKALNAIGYPRKKRMGEPASEIASVKS